MISFVVKLYINVRERSFIVVGVMVGYFDLFFGLRFVLLFLSLFGMVRVG